MVVSSQIVPPEQWISAVPPELAQAFPNKSSHLACQCWAMSWYLLKFLNNGLNSLGFFTRLQYCFTCSTCFKPLHKNSQWLVCYAFMMLMVYWCSPTTKIGRLAHFRRNWVAQDFIFECPATEGLWYVPHLIGFQLKKYKINKWGIFLSHYIFGLLCIHFW